MYHQHEAELYTPSCQQPGSRLKLVAGAAVQPPSQLPAHSESGHRHRRPTDGMNLQHQQRDRRHSIGLQDIKEGTRADQLFEGVFGDLVLVTGCISLCAVLSSRDQNECAEVVDMGGLVLLAQRCVSRTRRKTWWT